MRRAPGTELECVADPGRAAALIHPMRLAIVALAREPASAAELARRLGLPRQRVNYHVRVLASRGLLRRSGRARRRNMIEQRYVASARGFVLLPDVLGELAADWRRIGDAGTADHLVALAGQIQSDLARTAAATGPRVAALTLKAQFRLETAEQRAAFARELREAVVAVVARHTSPDGHRGARDASGRRYRLVLGCYPYVSETTDEPGGR